MCIIDETAKGVFSTVKEDWSEYVGIFVCDC